MEFQREGLLRLGLASPLWELGLLSAAPLLCSLEEMQSVTKTDLPETIKDNRSFVFHI